MTMNEHEHAKILFRPICGNCRRQLDEYIYITEDYYHVENSKCSLKNSRIYPVQCKYCGALFDCVEMPTKLPFDNRYDTTPFLRNIF